MIPRCARGGDLGYIPIVIEDACGFGHRDAAERSLDSLKFMGDALFTDVETICTEFRRLSQKRSMLTESAS